MYRKNKERRQTSTECVHDVCVCVCVRERERVRMRENVWTNIFGMLAWTTPAYETNRQQNGVRAWANRSEN